MNVPEYRQAVRDAMNKFRLSLEAASEALAKDLAVADERFFNEQPNENVPIKAEKHHYPGY